MLAPPARYTPWMKGLYEVSPNLKPFGTDFGNGEQDTKLFQFDRDYSRYRQSKRAAREEEKAKYFARLKFPEELETEVLEFICARLIEEGGAEMKGSKLLFSSSGESVDRDLDSIALALQEDLAVVCYNEGKDWISYLSVCNPSHWAPTDKIGLSFFDAHTVVPGFEKVNAVSEGLVQAMIFKGPFVRFVWGLETDAQLNHHPIAPPGLDQKDWYGRDFTRPLFARVERQVLWPFPESQACLFTIRPYVYPMDSLKPEECAKLEEACKSMTPEAKKYKGLPETIFSEKRL